MELLGNNQEANDDDCPQHVFELKDELLQYILINKECEDLYMDQDQWFKSMQEEPVTVGNTKQASNGCYKTKNGELFTLLRRSATKILLKVQPRDNLFKIPKANQSNTIRTICGWIVSLRNSYSHTRREITERTHPEFWKHVKDEPDMNKVFYLVSQKDVMKKMVGQWGFTVQNQRKDFQPSDYCRLIGILLCESMRDECLYILGAKPDGPSGTTRLHQDNRTKYNKDGIFQNVASMFNDRLKIVSHPPNWDRALLKYGERAEKIDPNDPKRVVLGWTKDDMMKMYSKIEVAYKKTMKKWSEGTGGGSGAPEDYENWQERDPVEYFDGYSAVSGAGIYLTWVYMRDQAVGYLLFQKFEGIPKHAIAEKEFDENDSSLSYTSMSTPRNTSSKRSLDKLFEETNASMGKFTKDASSTLSELVETLKTESQTTQGNKRAELRNNFEQTRKLVDDIKGRIANEKKKPDSSKRAKKLKKLREELKTFESMEKSYLDDIRDIMKTKKSACNTTNDSSDNDSSSDDSLPSDTE